MASMGALAAVGIKGQCYASDVARFIGDEEPALAAAAIEALANMGERGASFADEIGAATQHYAEMVRVAAIEALSKMGDAGIEFLSLVEKAKYTDYSPKVQAAAEVSLRTLSESGRRALE